MNKSIPITQKCKSPVKQAKGIKATSKKMTDVKKKSRHDGSYDSKLFPPIKDYSGKTITPGYDPKKEKLYKKNAQEAKSPVKLAPILGMIAKKVIVDKIADKAKSPMKKISPACKTAAKKKFDVWPSAYASGWGVRCTKAGGPGKMGKKSPAKQAKPKFTDKLYEKAEKLQSKADNAASKGKYKKAARLENRVARVEKRENKKRAKYNY